VEIGAELIECASAETAPRGRIEGERARTVGQLKLFADVARTGEWADLRIDHAIPDRKPMPRADLRLRNVPLGPVAVFGASNVSARVLGRRRGYRLGSGRRMSCHREGASGPSRDRRTRDPGRGASCGLPDGGFSLLLGAIETGSALVADPRIKAVGFTGSRGGRMALVRIAAARPDPSRSTPR
jgi:2,5-dioxopentanoate dehydrogenase